MKVRRAAAEYRGRKDLRSALTALTGIIGLRLCGGGGVEGQSAAIPPSAVAPARIAALSAAYRGTPYKLDCLGEERAPDTDPLFTRKFADCQTLVEQVMAEAIAPHVGGLAAAGRTIRYRGGEISLANRHHYCIPDWLTHPWPARDVTAEVGGKRIKTVHRRIDLAQLLAGRGAGRIPPTPARPITTPYIPRAQVRGVLERIPDGSIVVFVLDKPGIVAGHLGFAFRSKQGVVLRHASQRKMRVIDEPLSLYIGTARKSVMGIKVLQPDVRGLKRPARL